MSDIDSSVSQWRNIEHRWVIESCIEHTECWWAAIISDNGTKEEQWLMVSERWSIMSDSEWEDDCYYEW